MKILYAIQGTGNGHLCRAIELIPHFKKHGEVDILISGGKSSVEFPFEVKYFFNGVGFVFGKKGGIDLLNTYMKNHMQSFMQEVKQLPVEEYDLIISDFEPISAWAAYIKNIHCVGLSNQCAIPKQLIRKSKDDLIGKFVLKYYAPCKVVYGYHYQPYAPHIFTPIIRERLRSIEVKDLGHYTVYLPAYSLKRILKILDQIPEVNWEIFSSEVKEIQDFDHIRACPIGSESFLNSLATSRGVLCAAGFGTTSESLFLHKKLMVVPQKQQIEQYCNALALKKMGVPIMNRLKLKNLDRIRQWVNGDDRIKVDYPNQTKEIVDTIINNEYFMKDNYLAYLTQNQYDLQS